MEYWKINVIASRVKLDRHFLQKLSHYKLRYQSAHPIISKNIYFAFYTRPIGFVSSSVVLQITVQDFSWKCESGF